MKKQHYDGFITSNKQDKKGADTIEVKEIASNGDFLENDIKARNEKIIIAFINFLKRNNLIEQ